MINDGAAVIPVQVQGSFSVASDEVEYLKLKDLGIKEADLEEFVRRNIALLLPDETLLIVGQQVKNQQGGRSDLVALDGDGNIVLLELKRDVLDIATKKEPFEFQAIRYVANYALIFEPEDLVQRLFAPYVTKHLSEFSNNYPNSNPTEIARSEIQDFLSQTQDKNSVGHQVIRGFNRSQRIVLIASDFDRQTLSACAWLFRNGIDIRCISFTPFRYNQQHFLSVKQIIPPPSLENFLVKVDVPQTNGNPSTSASQVAKQSLPRIAQMMEWNLIAPGNKLYISTCPSEVATIKSNNKVTYQDKDVTFNAWGQKITGWSAINIYEWTIDQKTGKTLDYLRREKVKEMEQADSDSIPITADG